jgi:hypothetical protein
MVVMHPQPQSFEVITTRHAFTILGNFQDSKKLKGYSVFINLARKRKIARTSFDCRIVPGFFIALIAVGIRRRERFVQN